jgi:hypothetical protein
LYVNGNNREFFNCNNLAKIFNNNNNNNKMAKTPEETMDDLYQQQHHDVIDAGGAGGGGDDDDDFVSLSQQQQQQQLQQQHPVSNDEQDRDEQEHEERYPLLHLLNPPQSCGENLRDVLLRMLDHPVFQVTGIIVLVLVVIDGAFFFFLLVGWHNLCDTPSRTDCEPRNRYYNISVQILVGLFTYMALDTITWRTTNFLHTMGWSCPYRRNAVGHDLYGQPTKEMWFHIPLQRRKGILMVLLLNCWTQFANQWSRIQFSTYQQQSTMPGVVWINLFFVLSMVCGFIGAAWYLYEEYRLTLRNPTPGTFEPGVIDYIKSALDKYVWKTYKMNDTTETEIETTETSPPSTQHNNVSVIVSHEINATVDVEGHQQDDAVVGDDKDDNDDIVPSSPYVDPTENVGRHRIIPISRSVLRTFGL